ncbi:hypothetical protein GGX14DRAFT_561572 [Mycena pura]|uniref:Uncharacterized protein n=1 Tax=Mycena pura TaxID=153505 RepID=A0AAD6Y758_9AGAR|nr:hypothetical protein GGX14DRAFT_574190 [Mycena pura]KAJ7217055.1 hypothetical protein GGX14DRAFT_561572 [Mycena pura]
MNERRHLPGRSRQGDTLSPPAWCFARPAGRTYPPACPTTAPTFFRPPCLPARPLSLPDRPQVSARPASSRKVSASLHKARKSPQGPQVPARPASPRKACKPLQALSTYYARCLLHLPARCLSTHPPTALLAVPACSINRNIFKALVHPAGGACAPHSHASALSRTPQRKLVNLVWMHGENVPPARHAGHPQVHARVPARRCRAPVHEHNSAPPRVHYGGMGTALRRRRPSLTAAAAWCQSLFVVYDTILSYRDLQYIYELL